MRNSALPTWALSADCTKLHYGTSFVAQAADGLLWLVTTGHMAAWGNSLLDFDTWSPSLFICGAGAHFVELALFDSTPSGRTPRFRYFADAGKMADFIVLPLGSRKPTPIATVDVVDFTAPRRPLYPSEIVAYGFPKVGEKWPELECQSVRGTLERLNGCYEGRLDGDDLGFSGAPVFTAAGAFVGMQIGFTDGWARFVPDFVLRDAVNGRLTTAVSGAT